MGRHQIEGGRDVPSSRKTAQPEASPYHSHKPTFCYWSVADGQHALMMQTCVRSARAAGVTEDFHVWSDRAIAGAIAHDAGQFDKHLYHFKFDFLQKQAARLNYDYFVWLDADNYFVRHPGDVLRVLDGDAIHACLESNLCALDNLRPDWWGFMEGLPVARGMGTIKRI